MGPSGQSAPFLIIIIISYLLTSAQVWCCLPCRGRRIIVITSYNKKHLKNVGPICQKETPHANSPDVASGTVARRLRIDVYDNANDDDNDNA